MRMDWQRSARLMVVGFLVAGALVVLAGCRAAPDGQPAAPAARPSAATTVTPVAAPVAQPTGTPSPTPPDTVTPTPTTTASFTPSPTASPTATTTPSDTPTPTATATATATPGPTPDGTARSVKVPILMYHHVETPPEGADAVRKDISVAPERFESHLRYLRDAGYHVITLDDLLAYLTRGQPLPAKPVILSFDDGYEDNFTNAFPLLRQYGMVGHFFLITDFMDGNRPGYLNWAQVETMAAAGQRFGSHSRDHPDLRGKSVDYLVWQALGGKEAIEAHLGYHPRWISYPGGGYDAQTIAVYQSANYWGGLTTRQGATQTLAGIFELTRVRVRGTHTADDLAQLLELDW